MRKDNPLPADLCQPSKTFYVGRDPQGCWVAQDSDHLRGGLFVSRAAALKFALFENGNRPQAIISVPDRIELDFSAGSSGTPRADAPRRFRRAA